jgi:hypothetical protein
MAEPKVFVSSPVRKPRRGGIKSVVDEFISIPRLGAASELEWVSDGCEFPQAAPGLCYATTPITDDKEFNGISQGTGPIFGLYTGVHCYLGANNDYEERAANQLEQGEARGVEEVLWEYVNTMGGTGPAQTSWVAAFGQAEEAADTLYLGRPIIMISRLVAVLARSLKLIFGDEEGNLWTANGTPVIASAAASDTVLVVMGWVTVYAGEVNVVRAIDQTVNQELALAEGIYGIAVDCNFALHYAVTVPPAGDDPGDPDPDEPLEILLGSIPSSPIPDGTDVTIIAQTNIVPPDEVFLWYSINGGVDTLAGEMTQTNPHEFVWNVIGTSTGPGDSVEVWSISGTTESNHITIVVT